MLQHNIGLFVFSVVSQTSLLSAVEPYNHISTLFPNLEYPLSYRDHVYHKLSEHGKELFFAIKIHPACAEKEGVCIKRGKCFGRDMLYISRVCYTRDLVCCYDINKPPKIPIYMKNNTAILRENNNNYSDTSVMSADTLDNDTIKFDNSSNNNSTFKDIENTVELYNYTYNITENNGTFKNIERTVELYSYKYNTENNDTIKDIERVVELYNPKDTNDHTTYDTKVFYVTTSGEVNHKNGTTTQFYNSKFNINETNVTFVV